jgi:Na+-transporting NADH:ubiquinone oxidoreductase subunit NqrD
LSSTTATRVVYGVTVVGCTSNARVETARDWGASLVRSVVQAEILNSFVVLSTHNEVDLWKAVSRGNM